jgi:SAM-dependent methyltransferase|nr:MAG: methyltransferase type 11 [Bacteroidota bacterium]
MRYELLKDRIARFTRNRPWGQRLFYALSDLLLLRNWHLRRALRRLRPLMPRYPFWALDAGTGFGLYAWRILRYWPQARVLALDVKKTYLESARRFLHRPPYEERIYWVLADLERFGTAEPCFDLILCVDVLEHIPDDEAALRAMAAMLRPGGYLLLNTPSDQGGSGVEQPGQGSFIEEHAREGYNRDELLKRLRALGLHPMEARYTYGWPGQWAWRLLIRWPLPWLERRMAWPLIALYYLFALPVGLLLHALDVRMDHPTGAGLLLIVRKPEGCENIA